MFSRVRKRRFRFNIAWGTGNTILTENVATAVKAEKKGLKKSQKRGLFVANYRFDVCLCVQNIDTLDYISICACKLTYLKKCIIPENMKHLLSLSALAKEKGNPISMDKS